MDSQMQRPTHAHHQYEENPQMIEGEGHDQQGEKKSVLKKVKEKAKKIKNTITKHSHGHEHEPEHEHDPLEEEDDNEDEEMVDDPEIHGAPVYDSTVIRSTNLPRQVDPPPVNLEKPMDKREDRYSPKPNVRDEGVSKLSALGNLGPQLENKNNTPNPNQAKEKPNLEESRVKVGSHLGSEKDPHSPKTHPTEIPVSNYQSKVIDPTGAGGKEADVDPLVHRLDNLNVHDESKQGSEQRGYYSGSHDQFAPQPNPTKDQFNLEESKPIGTESSPKSLDPSNPESAPPDTVAGRISSATYAIADRAISAKNVVASKLGYGGGQQQQEIGQQDTSKKPVTEPATGYVQTVTEKLAPVYDKVSGAGSAVMSKVPGIGGTGQQGGDVGVEKGSSTDKGASVTEPATGYVQTVTQKLAPVYDKVAGAGSAVMSKVPGIGGTGKQGGDVAAEKGSSTDKGVSVKDYLAEKFRPGDEDKALSEAISGSLYKKKPETEPGTGEHKPPPMGKVTESKEVAERLGTGKEGKREGEDALAAGSESSGQGMVDRFKDAVGGWLGKSTGMQTAEESMKQSHVSDAGSDPTGGGVGEDIGQLKLQESSH